jgi:N-methylhydantoinase B
LITAEVIRHALNSAARQMMQTLIRTAFSPIIYEAYDFVVALYDRDNQMLAQAPTNPIFMGTMSFCVKAAVAAAGGEEYLHDGDIIVYNWPYGTGSHAQDCVLVTPVYFRGEHFGYSTIKAHWMDLGGKEFYSTDTTDVFQEGTFFPGLKLYKAGRLDDEVRRTIVSNSRLPVTAAGDLDAHVNGVRAGARALEEIVRRYGLEVFRDCVSAIYDHGEALVRSYFERIPDGVFSARGRLDNDGINPDPVEFEVRVEIKGSSVTIDLTNAPDAVRGPINCPLPTSVSCCRVAIAMMAGNCEMPTEGHFRPIEVVTRPGSLFHPSPPAPCFLYAWPGIHAIEVITRAIEDALPGAAPARSGGDLCSMVWWGERGPAKELWADGATVPVGQGAHAHGDGADALIHLAESASQFTPLELLEARMPVLFERMELLPDSCGPGTFQGGLGVEVVYRWLEDCYLTSALEQTLHPPWGLAGGGCAAANVMTLHTSDGKARNLMKTSGLKIAAGSRIVLRTGGGGGYGPPAQRASEKVRRDIVEGYITEDFARVYYPHARLPTVADRT